MLKDLSAANIYIVCGHTDMRKSIDGLAAIVQQQHKLDLFSDSADMAVMYEILDSRAFSDFCGVSSRRR